MEKPRRRASLAVRAPPAHADRLHRLPNVIEQEFVRFFESGCSLGVLGLTELLREAAALAAGKESSTRVGSSGLL